MLYIKRVAFTTVPNNSIADVYENKSLKYRINIDTQELYYMDGQVILNKFLKDKILNELLPQLTEIKDNLIYK